MSTFKTLGTLRFNIKDQKKFANFSGDYNPIHIDDIAARRIFFGQPVVHGINIVLNALEAWSKSHRQKFHLSVIEGEFKKPFFLDKKIDLKTVERDGKRHVKIMSENGSCASFTFELADRPSKEMEPVIDRFPAKISPIRNTLTSIKDSNGEISLDLKKEYLRQYFPNLHRYASFPQIASLLSSTRTVGMYCPGMNSIYLSFKFSFAEKSQDTKFKLDKIDRFGLASIVVDGYYSGEIKAFLRPDPVKQLNFSEVKRFVEKNEFKNQSALIIGGSRGVGEVVAKILAAGNADVLITYNKGEADAKAVCDDIKLSGGKISMIYYDIHNPTRIGDFEPSDIYYFATPAIFSGEKDKFSSVLAAQFSEYYLKHFHDLVRFWSVKNVSHYFYPSSTFVENFPEAMMEYSLAKLSGEKMCAHLEKSGGVKIFRPRLPRLTTDQTVSFLPVKNADTLQYMIRTMKEYSLYTLAK